MLRQSLARLAVRTCTAMSVLGSSVLFAANAGAATGCASAVPLAPVQVRTSSAAKSEAILGRPSRLLELQQQQAQVAEPAAVPVPSAGPTRQFYDFGVDIAVPAPTDDLASIWMDEPSEREHSTVTRAVGATLSFAVAARLDLSSRPAPLPAPCGAENWADNEAATVAPRKAEYVRAGQPDIFGTVALSVSRTPLDANWAIAAAGRDLPSDGPWAALVRDNRKAPLAEKIAHVNAWVNGRLRFVDDRLGHGRADYWAPAARTLNLAKGDCEDYAIAKLQLLAALGVSRSDLYLVIVRDLTRRADHAVLGVRIDGQMVVLDNQTDRVIPTAEINDYRPVLTYSHESRWTHGYRSGPAAPSIQLASR